MVSTNHQVKSNPSVNNSTSSQLALTKDSHSHLQKYSKRIILVVIILAMLAVILGTLFAIFNTPDQVITRNIESLVQDYYENYFYDSIGTHSDTPVNRTEVLAKYEQNGFAAVSLKQLLYFDNERHISEKSTLESYCDLTGTFIRIYPDAPFGRTDYHVDYHYSCNF